MNSSEYYHDPRAGVVKSSYKRLQGPPQKRPLTICIQLHANDLDHRTVLALANQRLRGDDRCHVVSVQYVPRNVITGVSTKEDRWLITVNCEKARKRLMSGLFWNGLGIPVRPFDDVLHKEYQAAIKLKMIRNQMALLKK